MMTKTKRPRTLLSLLTLAGFALVLGACDPDDASWEEPEDEPRQAEVHESTAPSASAEHRRLDEETIDEIFDYVTQANRARDGSAVEELPLATPPGDPQAACGFDYTVCVGWCMANWFDNECFSFCVATFC